MEKVTIVDAPCGYGKSTWAINYMNDNMFERFIYITPFLDELKRVIKSCDRRKFKQPNERLGKGSKTNHFYKMLDSGVNICSTHSLFKNISKDIIEEIQKQEYILILDEVFDVVENLNVSKHDINMLINEGIISVDEKSKVHWEKNEYIGKFISLKNPIENGDVYLYSNTMILWTFPASIFKAFKKVYVLTYMFDAQIQRYYYDLNNIKYEYQSVELKGIEEEKRIYELIDYKEIYGAEYKELINIYEGKLNDIGEDEYALSKSWYDKANKKELMKILKNNVVNYYIHIIKSKSAQNLWTTFKDYKTQCQGKGYTKGYLSCNARATNDYKDRNSLAYLCNRYYNPVIKNFFIERGVNIDEDQWALSELVQWIYRSAIREKNPINIYLPSNRMRSLLNEWLSR